METRIENNFNMSQFQTPSREEEMRLFIELCKRKERLLKKVWRSEKMRRQLLTHCAELAKHGESASSKGGVSLYALLSFLRLLKKKGAQFAALEREAIAQRNRIVEANLRLVVFIARRKKQRGLGLMDLIDEGSIGLMKAVSKFECGRGYKFSAYAVWWIHQAMDRAAADKGRVIRIPAEKVREVNKLERAEVSFVQAHGRKPTPGELAQKLGWAAKKVERMQKIVREPISLELPLGDGNGGDDKTLGEMLENIRSPSPENAIAEKRLGERLDYHLGRLSPKEEDVLRRRFGMGVSHNQTLEEIGQRRGVTRERIRQIEARGLDKLKRFMQSEGGVGGRRFLANVQDPQ